MKKIISLLSVFAMIATMFTTVAFADDNNKFYFEETVDGTNVTLTVLLKTNLTIKAASGSLDLAAAYGVCDAITFVKNTTEGVTSNLNVNGTQKVAAWNMASTDGFDGVLTLGTITFENVKSDFVLPQKKAFTAKNTASVLSSFTNEQVGYTVKAPAAEDPEIVYPFDGSKAFSFKANAETYVSISKTNSEEVNNFWLPKGVKGDASVYGLFKYTADGTDVVAGDVFTIDFVNSDSAAVEVEVAQ